MAFAQIGVDKGTHTTLTMDGYECGTLKSLKHTKVWKVLRELVCQNVVWLYPNWIILE